MAGRFGALALLLLTGCVVEPDVASTGAAVTVPGPWNPPPETRAIAASQFVPVVDPPPVSPDGFCTSGSSGFSRAQVSAAQHW